MPAPVGTRLAHYEILSVIGAGGMGEVYKARDPRLDRDVALKILPEQFANDSDRLARFKRESKTLAALNHPNIAQIHGVEESGSSRALVMEFVGGEDLSARIARGPIATNDAIPIAKQIADALEAAHERGIVHRDLKPANIRVTADGTVKVLDFGLAKAADPAGGLAADAMSSPTFTSPDTQLGVVLGTAAYMAPEQATGKAVDKRADIWAFGVILREMLTGRKLFAGDTVSETLAAVIKDDPRLDLLPSGTPPALRQLLARCLERDPKLRLRDIGEARVLLGQRLDPPPASDLTRPSRRTWLFAAAAMVLAALAGAAWYFKPAPPIPLRRFDLPPAIAASRSFALSPDGSRIAYIADTHLYVRALDALDAKDLGPLHVTSDQLFWSPDGRRIGFTSQGTIETVPAEGGPFFVVCRIPASARSMGAAWLTNGNIVFSVWRDSLYTVPATGGTPAVLLAIDAATEIDFHGISALPDGRFLVATHKRKEDVDFAELVDGTRRIVLTREPTLRAFSYVPPGFLLFLRRTTNAGLWAVRFSESAIDLTAATLIQPGATIYDVANDGTLIFGLQVPSRSLLVWAGRDGKMSPIPGAPVEVPTPDFAISPDGRRTAFIEGTGPDANVIVRDLEAGADTRLTFNKAADTGGTWAETRYPAWWPSGDRIVHATGGVESSELVIRRADVAGEAHELTPGKIARVSSDGRTLVYRLDDRGRGRLRHAPLLPDGTVGATQPVFRDENEPNLTDFDVSRDGRLLAYTARQADGRTNVYLTEYPNPSASLLVTDGGSRPRFSRDSRELFFLKGMRDARGQPQGVFMSAAVTSGPTVKIGGPVRLFEENSTAGPSIQGFDVGPDGRRFIMTKPVAPAPGEGTRLVLVQNWLAGMKGQ